MIPIDRELKLIILKWLKRGEMELNDISYLNPKRDLSMLTDEELLTMQRIMSKIEIVKGSR